MKLLRILAKPLYYYMVDAKAALRYQKGRRAKYFEFARMARKNNVVNFRIDRVADGFTRDWYDYKETTKEEKYWAYSKGFASYKLKYYGITKDNYHDFLSDYDYYWNENYLDKDFEALYESKIFTYFTLYPYKDNMPKHYYFIDRYGNIKPLGVEKNNSGTIDELISLVKQTGIAAKATEGGHGKGFYKLDFIENIFYVNEVETSEKDFRNLLTSMRCYLITDFLRPAKALQDLCGKDSFGVMRIVTVYDEQEGPQVTAALIRLGSKGAGWLTDFTGTVYCGIDLEKGTFFEPYYCDEFDLLYHRIEKHPDTNIALQGYDLTSNGIDWSELRKLVLSISRHLSMTPHLTFDIIPTDDGFKILEINSHGMVTLTEPYYPTMRNKYAKKLFKVQNV